MGEIARMCRFCLKQEKEEFSLIHIFGYKSENLCKQIGACVGIFLRPNDIIPPLICKNCINNIEAYFCFLEKVRKSEKILYNLYLPRKHRLISTDQTEQISEETIKNCPKNDIDVANLDDIISCDSDSNSNEQEKEILCKSNSAHALLPENKNKETAVYFPGGKSVNLFNVNETGENADQANNYSCHICCETFNSFFEYQDHQQTHDGQLVFCCSRCEQVFSNRQELIEHENNHKVSCDLCPVEVLPKSLSAHKKKHTDQFKCGQCQKRFTSNALLDRHYRAQHMGVKGYVCHICGKQNSCQSSMKRHLASHNTNRPFKCTLCQFTSKSKAVLQVHMQRKHTNQKSVCDVCAKIFKSELSLRQHMKRFHTPKKFKCKICDKRFSEKFNLDKHVLKKHTKQRLYECEICKQEFLKIRDLKIHMHTHRQGCENCVHCGKVFAYKKHLENHLQKCEMNPHKSFEMKSSVSMPNTSVSYDE